MPVEPMLISCESVPGGSRTLVQTEFPQDIERHLIDPVSGVEPLTKLF